MKRLYAMASLATGLSLFLAAPGRADCVFEVVGNAAVNNLGVLRATSLAPLGFGGASADLPDGFLFDDLEVLSTEFNLTDDGAGGGSPRFQLAIDRNNDGVSDGNLFVHLGTAPGFVDPGTDTWISSGNLVLDPDARIDAGQLGGSPVSTYADVQALLDADDEILSVSVVVDAGWFFADGEQTVLFRNILVNDCMAFDADGDGVLDAVDRCPDSDLRLLVDINGDAAGGGTNVPNRVDRFGCSIQDLVNHALEDATNHGQFVSAIAHLANNARKAGLLTAAQSNELKRAAAQSNIGQNDDDDDDGDDDDDDDDDDKPGKGKNKNKNKNNNGRGRGR